MIEQALSRDVPPQVCKYLHDLATSKDRQKQSRFADILARFEVFSIYGELEPRRQIRHLRGNISEIKTSEDRILFHELAATQNHRRVVRLTNACEKSKSKTQKGKLPRVHLERAEGIERIDRDV